MASEETVEKEKPEETESEVYESSDEDDFMSGLTEEQKKVIQERQAALQAKYKKFDEVQKVSKVQDVLQSPLCPEGLTEEEATMAIEFCNQDELEATQRLATEPDFLKRVREMVAERKWAAEHKTSMKSTDGGPKVMVTIDMDGKRVQRTTSRSNKEPSNKPPPGLKMNGEARAKSLRLGDALAQLEALKSSKEEEKQQGEEKESGEKKTKKTAKKSKAKSEEKEVAKDESKDTTEESKENEKESESEYTTVDLLKLGWSEARVKAFMNRKQNPNAYYYRFNAPGEEQATGEWDKTSIDLFMELIKEGVNYRWGEFSIKIPGRVGYQCSNFYRKLIQEGKISDPNYTFVDGKLKFTRPKGLKRGSSSACTVETNSEIARLRKKRLAETKDGVGRPVKKKKAKRRKGRKGDTVYADDVDSEADDSDNGGDYGYGGYGAKGSVCSKTSSRQGKRVTPERELLPGLRCPMTYEPIYDPAISPYGHVMSYDTWLRVLGRKPKNTCPFTKQSLTRRSLVKLTSENVDEFKSKIVAVNTTVNTKSTSVK